jgi:sugar phosphate permease
LRDPRLWRLASGGGLLVIAQASLLAFVVVFLHHERGWSTAAAAAVLAGVQVGGSVVRIAAGRWSDRREDRVAPMRLMAAASSVLLLAAAGLVHGPGWLLVPALLGAGVLAMGWNGLAFTAAAEMSGRDRAGIAISVQNTVLSTGSALAPMAFAPLVEATSWQAGWVALTAFQLAGIAVLGASVAEERRRRAARHARAADRTPRERGSWHPVSPASGRPAEEKAQ